MRDLNLTHQDLLELSTFILGPKLGSGLYRDVYEFAPDPSLVIKVERQGGQFSNATEWQVWQETQFMELRKWLAPCVAISQSGNFLLMKRTLPIADADMPKRIPRALTDEKVANWGRLGKKIVCHDYGYVIRRFEPGMKRAYPFET